MTHRSKSDLWRKAIYIQQSRRAQQSNMTSPSAIGVKPWNAQQKESNRVASPPVQFGAWRTKTTPSTTNVVHDDLRYEFPELFRSTVTMPNNVREIIDRSVSAPCVPSTVSTILGIVPQRYWESALLWMVLSQKGSSWEKSCEIAKCLPTATTYSGALAVASLDGDVSSVTCVYRSLLQYRAISPFTTTYLKVFRPALTWNSAMAYISTRLQKNSEQGDNVSDEWFAEVIRIARKKNRAVFQIMDYVETHQKNLQSSSVLWRAFLETNVVNTWEQSIELWHDNMVRLRVKKTDLLFEIMVDRMMKHGQWSWALYFLRSMVENGIPHTMYTWQCSLSLQQQQQQH
eukprot:PhF_6_TR2236/c0_g1_i2/m.3785